MKKLIFILITLLILPALAHSQTFRGSLRGVVAQASTDVTAPTVSSSTIGTNGTALTLAMSETVTRSGGTFDVDCGTAGSDITATYSSGSGSSSLIYTLGTTVNSGDTCNLDYNGASNGIEDTAGNDLASITSAAVTNNSTQGSCTGSSCTGFSPCQNFENTGYDNSESWTEALGGGTVNEDATATAMRGSQYLRIASSSSTSMSTFPLSSDLASFSLHFIYRPADGTPSEQHRFFRLSDSTDSTSITCYHRTDGNLRCFHGSNYAQSSDTPVSTDGQAYHIWIDGAAGTGTNGTLSVYVSTTKTKPASANVSVTNGTMTASVHYVQLRSGESGSLTSDFDFILMRATTIGDVCD